MQISIFADEISDSPKRAIDLARAWQVSHLEVRSFPAGRFPAVSDTELDSFTKQITDAGLSVSGVSPGFFKCPWDDPSVMPGLREYLPRACEWARRWGTDLVTCFACTRDDSNCVPQSVIDLMGQMATEVRTHGCRLALENEAGCWGDTGVEATGIIRQVGLENISLCWDPGNSARAGSSCPFPNEYDDLKAMVSHVHMKNFDPATDSWSLMDRGVVDWPRQLEALSTDGYDGFIVIETHLHVSPDEYRVVDRLSDLESNTLRNLRFVQSCLKK